MGDDDGNQSVGSRSGTATVNNRLHVVVSVAWSRRAHFLTGRPDNEVNSYPQTQPLIVRNRPDPTLPNEHLSNATHPLTTAQIHAESSPDLKHRLVINGSMQWSEVLERMCRKLCINDVQHIEAITATGTHRSTYPLALSHICPPHTSTYLPNHPLTCSLTPLFRWCSDNRLGGLHGW